jgi:hypothetical protein
MKFTLLATSTAMVLSLMNSESQAAEPQLTVYSGDFDAVAQSEAGTGGPGFALYEQLVSFNLKSGDNAISLAGLPRALDSSSVNLKPQGDARVRAQRFDFAIAGQDELLRRSIGQTVSVEQSVGSDRQQYSGVLMAAGNGLTLKLPDGRIKVLSNYSSFELPRLPEGIANEPTLHWVLAAGNSGTQTFALNYATAGLAWRAEYRIDTRGQGVQCKMDMEGAAMVVNRSGVDFNDVRLTLVAGEPNRTAVGGPELAMAAAAPMSRKMVMADSAPSAQASGEYQSYTLPNPGSLPQGSVQRLPLLNPTNGISCERRYETQFNMGDWRPPYPILDENFGAVDGAELPVVATLRFKNSKTAGLGLPLPAGRVRIFEGQDFLGEAAIGHTPANGNVNLPIGTVFDLQAKRSRVSYSLDRAGRTLVETVRLDLNNAKKQAANIRVLERLPRWSEWQIESSSVPFEKRDAQTVSFDVPLAAESEGVLTYTVRYRWPSTVKIPN